MFKSIDQALAGAIDVIADDVTATVKSVKEQGMMRTLGDAVEDAAGLVKSGAGSALSGIIGGKKGPEKVSNHSGLGSGYADICAGGRSGAYPGQAAAFPYVPNPPSAKAGGFGGSKAPNVGSFGPGVGIRLPGQGGVPGMPGAQGGVQVFAGGPPPAPAIAPYAGRGAGAAATAGAFRPPAQYAAPGPAAYASPPSYASPSAPAPAASGGKDPTISAEELARRFEVIVAKEAANTRCFDCGSNDHEWASVSFGILLCITCAGHHRQLGTHISRIRSCKMDSWTERQLQLFGSGGNQRMADFFRANGVPPTALYQRYATPAAEWYREAWIKNRTLGRPVPAPPQGVVVGPCVDDTKPAESASQAKPATPPADLLDFGGDAPKAAAPASAAQADLLAFGDEPAARGEADLLGVAGASSSPGGDLLNLGSGGGGAGKVDDLLGLASTAANARPPASALASLDFGAAPIQAPTPALASPAPAAAPWAAPAAVPAAAAEPARQNFAPPAAANTLGGGAKLAEPAKQEKADDPFAMALKQWGM